MQKALFLDRDGVINVDSGYLYEPKKCAFIDGIFELTHYFHTIGYLIIVVTNQSGIARGYFTQRDFEAFSTWMREEFRAQGAHIDAIYHCPHHPDFTGACQCRKPAPGMLLAAAEAYNIDLANSLLIGDSERDIIAAQRAGVSQTYLLCHVEACESSATVVVHSLHEVIGAFKEKKC